MFALAFLAIIFFLFYIEIKTAVDNYIAIKEMNKRRR